MPLCPWEDLPHALRCAETRPYYDVLRRKRLTLACKRGLDIAGALAGMTLLLPVGLAAAAAVKLEDGGPALFRQTRLTRYGRPFSICKLRTMSAQTPKAGNPGGQSPLCTAAGDRRITRTGRVLRKFRLDELPQLWNILAGDMSFVGPRPEVPRYVAAYSPRMMATLLVPAGLTSPASVAYRGEDELLGKAADPEEYYKRELLPRKMALNLRYIETLSLAGDIACLFETAAAVFLRR